MHMIKTILLSSLLTAFAMPEVYAKSDTEENKTLSEEHLLITQAEGVEKKHCGPFDTHKCHH